MKSIIIFILLIFSHHLYAFQYAKVTSDKAHIYMDSTMKTSIGYFLNGTRIKVGDKIKGRGQIIATAYNRKIMYIYTKDIEFESNKLQSKIKKEILQKKKEKSRYRAESIRKHEEEEKFNLRGYAKNMYIRIENDTFSYDPKEWETISKNHGSDELSSGKSLRLGVEYRLQENPFSIGIGINHSTLNQSPIKLDWYSSYCSIYYKILNLNKFISIEALAGGDFSIQYNFTNTDQNLTFSGYKNQYYYGLSIILFPYTWISPSISITKRHSNITQFKPSKGDDYLSIDNFSYMPSLNSISYSISFLFKRW